jgi:hypothetical protein
MVPAIISKIFLISPLRFTATIQGAPNAFTPFVNSTTLFLFSGVTALWIISFNSSAGKMTDRTSETPSGLEISIPLLQYPAARAEKVASNFSEG